MEIRERAKELGIKHYWNKKIENLESEIADAEDMLGIVTLTIDLGVKFDINTDEDTKYFSTFNFNFSAFRRYAIEMGATSAIYRKHKKAFECFKEKQTLDFLSIGMF